MKERASSIELPVEFLDRLRSVGYDPRAKGTSYSLSLAGRPVGYVSRKGEFAEFAFIDNTKRLPRTVTSRVALAITTEALVARLRRDIDRWRFAKPIRSGKPREVRNGIPRPELPVEKRASAPTSRRTSKRALPLTGAAAKSWASHVAQKPMRLASRDEAQWHGAQAGKWKKMSELNLFDDDVKPKDS
jgi:hypothetical protein